MIHNRVSSTMCLLGPERDIMQYLDPSMHMRAKFRKCFAQILRSGSVETQTSSGFAEIQVRASEPARDRSCPFSILAGISKDISSYIQLFWHSPTSIKYRVHLF